MEETFRKLDPTRQKQRPGTSVSVKPKRLSWSLRQTQQPPAASDSDSPKSPQPDFKTPTRLPSTRFVGGFNGDSPHNNSDLQQDIIWDSTSPSPNRLGKRGKKHPTSGGAMDISDIVSRIAPKHGRPRVAEPTLQQWIGDSATIPCTPDIPLSKPKKKSPRLNGVDDLLMLAKQFDYNMVCQDEDKAENLEQEGLQLLSEDILDFDNGNENNISPFLPGLTGSIVNATRAKDLQVHLGMDQEDDLDFLFDGPTQRLSTNLSQCSLAQPSQVKHPNVSYKNAPGKLFVPCHGPSSEATLAHTKATSTDDFEDDWENDDLLNDPLVIEVTQNPQKFAIPKHCSTQKPLCERQYQSDNTGNAPAVGAVKHRPSVMSNEEKENFKQRTIFKLESIPNLSVKKITTESSANLMSFSNYNESAAEKESQKSLFSSNKGTIETTSQQKWQMYHSNALNSDPQQSQFQQRTSVANLSAKYNMSASISLNTSAMTTNKTFPKKPSPPEVVSNLKPAECKQIPGGPIPLRTSDFLDEDLDSLFSSDSVWNDDDDDLLCEMCDDLESQIQSADNLSTKQALPASHMLNQRPVLAPSNRAWDNRDQQTEDKRLKRPPTNQHLASDQGGTCLQSLINKPTSTSLPSGSGRPAGTSFAENYTFNCSAGLQSNTAKESFRHTQARRPSTMRSSNFKPGNRKQLDSAPPLGNAVKDQTQFTFKKPHNPVAAVTSKAAVKCTAAEIEQKKQQALERRRQRIQAAQNLRAPT